MWPGFPQHITYTFAFKLISTYPIAFILSSNQDILNRTYNKNETYSENLIARCPEKEQEKRYEGVEGSLKCIDDTKAKVTFVDHKVIQSMINTQEELERQGLPVPRPGMF